MRRIRIHTEQKLKVDHSAELEASPARHLVKVLRQKAGHQLALFNGDGFEYLATITAIGPGDRCQVKVDQQIEVNTESPLAIALVQAIARGNRMDFSIQKACELGVASIRPIFSERTEVRLDAERAAKRRHHWQQVAIAACEQSGRVSVPEVAAPTALTDLDWPAGRRLHLDPAAGQALVGIAAPDSTGLVLAIGPEGGWTDSELAWLERQDSIGVRLGPRVLRAETAGPASIAALQAVFGDWR